MSKQRFRKVIHLRDRARTHTQACLHAVLLFSLTLLRCHQVATSHVLMSDLLSQTGVIHVRDNCFANLLGGGEWSPWTDDPGSLIGGVHLTAPLENSTDSLSLVNFQYRTRVTQLQRYALGFCLLSVTGINTMTKSDFLKKRIISALSLSVVKEGG